MTRKKEKRFWAHFKPALATKLAKLVYVTGIVVITLTTLAIASFLGLDPIVWIELAKAVSTKS